MKKHIVHDKKSSSKFMFLVFLLVIFGLYLFYFHSEKIDKITGEVIEKGKKINEHSSNIQVHFCPEENCAEYLESYIKNSERSVHCAFFAINLGSIMKTIEEKSNSADVKVFVDNENYNKEKMKSNIYKTDNQNQLSHNKFCVFDNTIVLAGSFNPTYNGNFKDNNNIVIIESPHLAENYENEFNELWSGIYGKGEKTKTPVIYYNNNKVENYFCPEDWCANKVLGTLDLAKDSIYFMTYSFTHDKIGDLLLEKHKEGVTIKGIFEKSQNSQYSEYEKLKNNNIEVIMDKNPGLMHHKVFIIDKKIVITGSFNPTINADTRNDENILIIHSPEIAEKYLREFNKLYN